MKNFTPIMKMNRYLSRLQRFHRFMFWLCFALGWVNVGSAAVNVYNGLWWGVALNLAVTALLWTECYITYWKVINVNIPTDSGRGDGSTSDTGQSEA